MLTCARVPAAGRPLQARAREPRRSPSGCRSSRRRGGARLRPAPAGRRPSGRRSARPVALRADAEAQQRRLVVANSRANARDRRRPRRRRPRRTARPGARRAARAARRSRPRARGTSPRRQAGVDHRPHHPERERGVGAGQRAQVLVGDARRAAAERIDDDQLRAAPRARRASGATGAARSTSGSSPRERRSARAATPRGRPRATRRCAPSCPRPRRSRRSCARARGAERVHHAVAHRVALDQALGARVAVGQRSTRRRARRSPRGGRRPRASSASSQLARRKRPSPFAPVRTSGCSRRSSE